MIRGSWATGGSIEATLELWASSLRDAKERIRPLFQQERTAASAGLFLDALLGPERRKTGWMRAEAAGDRGPWRQQALLDRTRWDADALRDLVRDYALETLADPDAAARSSPWSLPSVTPASITSSSANATGPWRSCRSG